VVNRILSVTTYHCTAASDPQTPPRIAREELAEEEAHQRKTGKIHKRINRGSKRLILWHQGARVVTTIEFNMNISDT